MRPGPNRAPPRARKATPPVVRPSSGWYLPKPRAGATEPKSIVARPEDAALNASRLSICSTPGCAEATAKVRKSAAEMTAHKATFLRGECCKVSHSYDGSRRGLSLAAGADVVPGDRRRPMRLEIVNQLPAATMTEREN